MKMCTLAAVVGLVISYNVRAVAQSGLSEDRAMVLSKSAFASRPDSRTYAADPADMNARSFPALANASQSQASSISPKSHGWIHTLIFVGILLVLVVVLAVAAGKS